MTFKTAETAIGSTQITLGDLISRFLGRPSLKPKSREYYANILSNFHWYAGEWRFPPPGEITRHQIRDFLDYVATERHRWPEGRRSTQKVASSSTVNHYGKAIKCLFAWAEAEEYIGENPSLRLKLAPANDRKVAPYSDEEVRALLERCQEDARFGYRYLGCRNLAIISLFVATGLRLEELAGIEMGDLDSRCQEVQVTGKGGKVRTVPINGQCRKNLKRYIETRSGRGASLWQHSDGGPMSPSGIKTMIARLKRRSGLDPEGGAHRFRHYFATRYLEAGGDINSLRLLLGHATLSMVLRYQNHISTRRALAEHEQYNPLDRLLYRGPSPRGWRR